MHGSSKIPRKSTIRRLFFRLFGVPFTKYKMSVCQGIGRKWFRRLGEDDNESLKSGVLIIYGTSLLPCMHGERSVSGIRYLRTLDVAAWFSHFGYIRYIQFTLNHKLNLRAHGSTSYLR